MSTSPIVVGAWMRRSVTSTRPFITFWSQLFSRIRNNFWVRSGVTHVLNSGLQSDVQQSKAPRTRTTMNDQSNGREYAKIVSGDMKCALFSWWDFWSMCMRELGDLKWNKPLQGRRSHRRLQFLLLVDWGVEFRRRLLEVIKTGLCLKVRVLEVGWKLKAEIR